MEDSLKKFFDVLYNKDESTKTNYDKYSKKNRCKVCNKKTGLDYFSCECDKTIIFCSEHRFPFSHNCSIDYKKLNEDKLKMNNPKIISDKFERI